MEDFFPGLSMQIVAAGGLPIELGSQARISYHGHQLPQAPAGAETLAATRPFLEGKIRAQVLQAPGVSLRDDTSVAGLSFAEGRVRGVLPAEESNVLEADLVVDATGRGARSGAWLEQIGHRRPPEQRVQADITYASRHYALPPDVLGTDRIVAVGATATRPRGMAFAAQENGTWVLSLQGYGDHRPPTDPEGFLAYAATVAPDDVMRHLRHAAPLDAIAVYRFPCGIRRRYERLRHFPTGLLVIGDAVCSLNPVYGAGMSLAATEAASLDHCLTSGDGSLAARYFHAVYRATNLAWWIAACGDYGLTHQNRKARLLGTAFRKLMAAAEHDQATATAVLRSLGHIDSPLRLAHPRHLRRILTMPAQTR
jgi:2-polyprenyl-6-methoxyphenol hydroxylase-like FAD-dependent oxidoreductase